MNVLPFCDLYVCRKKLEISWCYRLKNKLMCNHSDSRAPFTWIPPTMDFFPSPIECVVLPQIECRSLCFHSCLLPWLPSRPLSSCGARELLTWDSAYLWLWSSEVRVEHFPGLVLQLCPHRHPGLRSSGQKLFQGAMHILETETSYVLTFRNLHIRF